MLIDVKGLRGDSSTGYLYNELVEQEIARLLAMISGLSASDFGAGTARPEYDFKLGELPIELKITDGEKLPVEVAKDAAGLISSGIAISIAPYILYLSNGHGSRSEGSRPVGKLRLLSRKKLLAAAKKTPPSFYTKGDPNSTENALVCYLGPFFNDDIWLGDMQFAQDEKKERWLFDTSTFVPSQKAGAMLCWLNKGYIDGDIK
jgi:hypothetical protein